jgi:ribosomal protein S18 acetylase RimI-like enzyme
LISFDKDNSYFLSNEKSLLQVDRIYYFLKNHSYWANHRTLESIITGIDYSYCIGIYFRDAWSSFAIESQIGFARVVTDYTTFAYLCDVYIEEYHRNKGLATWMLTNIFEDPAFTPIQKWLLDTRDTQALYSKFGFQELATPKRWMEKAKISQKEHNPYIHKVSNK